MKVLFKKLKKSNKVALVFFFIGVLLYIGLYAWLIKNLLGLKSVETLIRSIVIAFFGLWFIIYLIVGLVKLVTKKYKLFIVLTIFTYLFIGVFGVGNYILTFAYNKLDNIAEKDMVTYTSVLLSYKDTKLDEDSIFGMISNKEDITGNILAKKLIKKEKLTNEIKKYDDYDSLLEALYSEEVDAIFIADNYVTLYSGDELFADIATETKVNYKYSEKRKNEDKKITSNKKLTEPFTILVLGVDSDDDGLDANAAFNGDTLILVTFNPKTLTASMFSIPRDTYVPIACNNNAYSKINSSAAYGTSCVIDTIENLTDIKIDYYVKINFKGVIDLVDAVGGVTVDVQEPDFNYNHTVDCGGKVCERVHKRSSENMVFITPGSNVKLNGEEALAYARCRHLYLDSDLARNRHQQDVITAVAKQAMKIRDFKKFEKVLDAVSNNISTNMSKEQIISSYNIIKDMVNKSLNDGDMITIKKTYLEVSSLQVNIGSMIASALSYYPASLEEITKMMKENLELEKPEMIKSFKFNANETYTAKIYGKGTIGGSTLSVMPNLIGRSVADAQSWGANNGKSVSFSYNDESSSTITDQSIAIGTLLQNFSHVTFTVGNVKPKTAPVEEPKENNEVDSNVTDMIE